MNRALFLAIFLLLPRLSLAETITAFSGEHADFSRIVLQFDNLDTWEFGRVAGGYELRTGLSEAEFDLSSVFDKIPKSRISEITSPANGRLFLSVSCQCAADVFEIRQGRVVIDVKSELPAEGSRFETQLSNLSDTAGAQQAPATASLAESGYDDISIWAGFGETFPVKANPTVTLNMENPDIEQHVTNTIVELDESIDEMRNEPENPEPLFQYGDRYPTSEPLTDIVEIESLVPLGDSENSLPTETTIRGHQVPEPDGERAESTAISDGQVFLPTWPATNGENFAAPNNPGRQRTTELEESLLKHLSRAASQGLVTISTTAPNDKKPHDHAGAGAVIDSDGQDSPNPQTHSRGDPLDSMLMQTSVDRDQPDRRIPELTIEGSVCLDDDIVDVSAWGNPHTSGSAFGSIRTGIVGEFDRPNSTAILALIRRYIYLGFGTEAKSLLTGFEIDVDNSDILSQLAEVIDYGQVHTPGRLISQVSCDTNSAMWAILALDNISPGIQVNTRTVLRTFSGLPAHLRHHVGSELAQRFIDDDDIETATSILSLMNRSPAELQPGSQLVAAELAAKAGKTDSQFTYLENAIQMPGPISAIALAEFIETKLEQNQPLSEQTALLAGAMAVETRDLEIGKRLTKAAIRAFAVTGQIEPTFQRIRTAMDNGYIDTEEAQSLAVETHLRNAQISSNAGFLTSFFRHRELLFGKSELARSGRLETARRLVELNFSEDARALYADGEIEKGSSDRIVIAAADLATGSLAAVHKELAGQTDQDSQQLIAAALEKQKDFGAAAEIYARLEQFENHGRATWLAGDWTSVVRGTNATRSAAAKIVVNASEIADATHISTLGSGADRLAEKTVTIAAGTELMERSANTRDVISDLLHQQ